MSFVDRLKNKITVKFVDHELSVQRLSTCKNCEEFVKITSQCKLCGCFLPAKTKLKNSSCPIKKW
jgi:hypothetical protein